MDENIESVIGELEKIQEIKNSPLSEIPKSVIEKALKLLEEFGEEKGLF